MDRLNSTVFPGLVAQLFGAKYLGSSHEISEVLTWKGITEERATKMLQIQRV